LVLKFSGAYRQGSAGNGDATLMRVITQAALSAWDPDAVVFDLRELDYKWGNGIWSVFGLGIPSSGVERLPRVLVVSHLWRGGFATCGGLVPTMFDDIEDAIKCVEEIARQERERRFADLDAGPSPSTA